MVRGAAMLQFHNSLQQQAGNGDFFRLLEFQHLRNVTLEKTS